MNKLAACMLTLAIAGGVASIPASTEAANSFSKRQEMIARIADRTYFTGNWVLYLGPGGSGYEPEWNHGARKHIYKHNYRIAGFRWSVRDGGTKVCRSFNDRAILCYRTAELLAIKSVKGDPFALKTFRVSPQLEAHIAKHTTK